MSYKKVERGWRQMGNQNGKKRIERIRIFWFFLIIFLKKRGWGGAKRMGFLM